MSEFILIRHGQAWSAAKTEKDYDRLSPLGYQQAEWLGAYLRDHYGDAGAVSGDLKRQVETVRTLALAGEHRIDRGLNELDYFGMSRSLAENHGVAQPHDVPSFRAQIPRLFASWQKGDLCGHLESYDDFSARAQAVLHQNGGNGGGGGNDGSEDAVILVTSAGVIAHLCALALRLDAHGQGRIYERVLHTSITRIAIEDGEFHMLQFAATPHLESAERRFAKTNI